MCTYKGLVDSINQINATQEKGQKIEKHKSRVPLNLFYTFLFTSLTLLCFFPFNLRLQNKLRE